MMPADRAVLIEPAELAELLNSDQPPVLADVRWTLGGPSGLPDYEAEHIPGTHWVDLEQQLSAPPGAGGRHPLPDPARFQAAMRAIGVRGGQPVVVYDAASSLGAARLWWLLTDAGHDAVLVLNGGLAAWRAAGLPTESGPSAASAPNPGGTPPDPPGEFVARPGQRAQLTADDIGADLAGDRRLRLVDVRAPKRFSGELEPIDPVAGHIPGAVNLPATGNLDANGRFLDGPAIVRRFTHAGVGTQAVLYCGSGIAAAHGLLALESAGLTGMIYPGSWSDWIADPARPVATGVSVSASDRRT
jgi:thiosulfate/3-mercaptopyruvate sulfurtransferase